jgi:fungal STAND N-terminal Goodbye domain
MASSTPGAALARDQQNQQISTLFRQAQKNFEVVTETTVKKEDLERYSSVDDFITHVQLVKDEFGVFRKHKHPAMWDSLKMALKPVQMLGGFAAGAASMVSSQHSQSR